MNIKHIFKRLILDSIYMTPEFHKDIKYRDWLMTEIYYLDQVINSTTDLDEIKKLESQQKMYYNEAMDIEKYIIKKYKQKIKSLK